MRAFVGFDDAISGCVLADTVFANGQVVLASEFQHLIVEFELALQFGQDLPDRDDDWDQHSILPYLDCAYPSLEIADDRFADYALLKQGFFSLVAAVRTTSEPVKLVETDSIGFSRIVLTPRAAAM